MIILYGIANCDTVKKARRWLDGRGIDYRFHDFRKDGIDKTHISAWLKKLGADVLLNRRGTTWRQLPEATKQGLTDAKLIDLLCSHPTLIKRPVLEIGGIPKIGFSESEYERYFA